MLLTNLLALGTGLLTPTVLTEPTDSLTFPVDSFTVKSTTVKTSTGDKIVSYRYYGPIAYVSRPIDPDYQSLTVKVPVSVNGVPVNTQKVPILLNITVGGYLSVNINRQGFGGPAGFPPPGGLAMNERPEGPIGPGGPGLPPGPQGGGKTSGRADLALAAGYVVVTPGVRGRDNKLPDGTYFGKAPAAIIDLKAAVRYIRHNTGRLPGNTNWIISAGVSAGGALSALLGASGDAQEYAPYLRQVGAAEAKDTIFASADYCPITDLDHADAAYEWMFGTVAFRGAAVDAALTAQLKASFLEYQNQLGLKGQGGFGALTGENYSRYLLEQFLYPAAQRFLAGLTEERRVEYLAKNPWLHFADGRVTFAFADYVAHVGRSKGLPAFDDFNMSRGEPIEFGTATTNARHFTDFTLRVTTKDSTATIDHELKELVRLMNPMTFTTTGHRGVAAHWWIRHGTSDSDTSLPVIVNLATSLQNHGRDVNARLYWDARHGADEDPEEFIAWIGRITKK